MAHIRTVFKVAHNSFQLLRSDFFGSMANEDASLRANFFFRFEVHSSIAARTVADPEKIDRVRCFGKSVRNR